jgi:lipid-A-disaccharide synthase
MKVLFCAGEASGDLYAHAIASELLSQCPEANIGGIGGTRFARIANQPLIKNSSSWGSISIVQSVREGLSAISTYERFRQILAKGPPGIFVPIDFGFMNLKLAKCAKENGWKVLYFVPPGSWRRDRQGKDLPKVTDHIVTPFPWSAEILNKMGANAHFFGHPLKQIHSKILTASHERHGTSILPGSRRSELEQLLPILPQIQVEAPRQIPCQPRYESTVQRAFDLPTDIITDGTQDGAVISILRNSKRAIVCSGTATLEAALSQTPMVVVYKVSKWVEFETKLIGWKRPQFISQPNILLNRLAVPELIQENCTVTEIQRAFDQLEARAESQLQAFAELSEILGGNSAISSTVNLLRELERDLQKTNQRTNTLS